MMDKNKFALTPPMGWNSYDYYDTTVTEDRVKANADYMAKHLKKYGWEYIVVDIEWYSKDAGTQRPEVQYIPFGDDEIDGYGRFQPAPNRFPSSAGGKGFTALAAYAHALGLKFGIHIMRGIPRQAAHDRLPVLGTEYTAADAADAFSICGWNPDMYGVKDNAAGQAYYDSIFAMYADWGVDFVKCDDICDSYMYREPRVFSGWHETEMIHKAILKSGRPIVLSLSPGPAQLGRAWQYAQNANMWRITDDFWDDWKLLREMFWRCETWQNHVCEGNYPDCDMLTLGTMGKGFGELRQCRFTPDEQKTMLTLWCMFRSPLMLGCELTLLDEATLGLITNADILSLLAADRRGRQLARTERYAVWANESSEGGKPVVALFNLADAEETVHADISDVLSRAGIAGTYRLTEAWDGTQCEQSGQAIETAVPAHGVKVYRIG